MCRELSLSRRREREGEREKEGESRGERELVTRAAFHLALSKAAYSVCTHAFREASFKRTGKKGERQDKESDMNPTTCSLFKGAKLCICLRKPLLYAANEKRARRTKKKEKKNRKKKGL